MRAISVGGAAHSRSARDPKSWGERLAKPAAGARGARAPVKIVMPVVPTQEENTANLQLYGGLNFLHFSSFVLFLNSTNTQMEMTTESEPQEPKQEQDTVLTTINKSEASGLPETEEGGKAEEQAVPKEEEPESKEESPKSVAVDERLTYERAGIDATKWSKEMNDLFIDLLIRESSENYNEKNENDWCKDSWSRITKELELAFPLKAKVNKFDKTKLKKHLKILKDEHAYWRFIKDHAKGFKWINSKGLFSLDYYEVDHYFAINKFIEDPEVVKKYQRKKLWLKKFCVPHACDYVVKYDKYIYSKTKGSVLEDDDEEEDEEDETDMAREMEIERKRRAFDLGSDEDEEDGEEAVGNGKLEANGEAKVEEDDINDEENELLELTGYGKPSKPKSKKRRVLNDALYRTSEETTVPFLKVNIKNFESVSKFVMKNVLVHKITAEAQQKLSKLLLEDLILFNFLNDPEFSEDDKLSYIQEITAVKEQS